MMFFRTGSSSNVGGGLAIGPININFYSFYSSIVSAAILVPAVFVLTQIFRNRRLKHAPVVDGKDHPLRISFQ